MISRRTFLGFIDGIHKFALWVAKITIWARREMARRKGEEVVARKAAIKEERAANELAGQWARLKLQRAIWLKRDSGHTYVRIRKDMGLSQHKVSNLYQREERRQWREKFYVSDFINSEGV